MFQDPSAENDIDSAILENDDFSLDDDETMFENDTDEESDQPIHKILSNEFDDEEDGEDDENPLFDSHDDHDLM